MAATAMDSSPQNSASTGRSSAVDSALGSLALEHESAIVPIAAHGDLVLRIEHETIGRRVHADFRVSTEALKQHSRYFGRLLQVGRFGEGNEVGARQQVLREQYQDLDEIPSGQLPVITVQDVGRISMVKSFAMLCADFLYILHCTDLQTLPPVANLANLTILADRFDALEVVKSYVGRKKTLRIIDGKTTAKADGALSEERVRQRLLVAIMLEHPSWMEKYSSRLIVKGWVSREVDLSSPLWWDLPSRVEEELAYRRECVLETVQSLQSYFLGLYASRERQCKLGYDSSPQCDSFQLGEMVRFFARSGTLKLQGGLVDNSDPPEPFPGDVTFLLDTLRQVPEYQIDRHHSHCGIRTRLLPLLDLVAQCLPYFGVCAACWADARVQYAWVDSKRPLLWKRQDFVPRVHGHGNRHADLRAMFTATERDWGS
ncbi:hypothetical protein B0A54_11648 [Friedmanniomyces endolithicus]|uniref:BTB domain-containing protein n=1 Tax=Friedmanniomyces endolithicus TaxID=329885 RepID=A0A4U0ULV1_9PEZI|nr:hypothetical protein B0A54_11648 [Friedmanniomyces endolithicus]